MFPCYHKNNESKIIVLVLRCVMIQNNEYLWRNWGKAGSHGAAENLVVMFSLYESCKMNNLNFGRYIEDIHTRMKDEDKDYRAMLPCFYVEKTSEMMGCT